MCSAFKNVEVTYFPYLRIFTSYPLTNTLHAGLFRSIPRYQKTAEHLKRCCTTFERLLNCGIALQLVLK